MKRFFSLALSFFILGSSLQIKAQEVTTPPPPPPPPPAAPVPPPPPPLPPGKMQSEEIIIKRNPDKDANLEIQISGDKVTVNGKPLMEFNEDGITINKKKIIVKDGNKISIWDNPDGPVDLNFDQFFNGNNGKEKITFLGVSTAADKDGALIKEVTKDSPAEKAGLQKGDIITKVGSTEITTPDDLSNAIRAKNPNDEVKISFRRNGKKKSTKAILAQRLAPTQVFGFANPDGNFRKLIIPPSGFNRNFNFDKNWYDQFRGNGNYELLADSILFHGKGYFDGNRKRLGLKIQDTEDESGVKVLEVEDSSAAHLAGIQKGDIITRIGDDKVLNTDDAREELADNRDKTSYKITVQRNGKEMIFTLRFPKKLKTANL